MSCIVLVLAMASNGVIGAQNTMPWRLPEDLKHFKAVTMGKPIIMGRKTWDSFPKKPLPGRTNIVVTRDHAWAADGAVTASSLEDAIAKAGGAPEIAIIGGAQIFLAALPIVDAVELTEIHADFDGDTHMPPFGKEWREISRRAHATADGLRYDFVRLERERSSL